METSNPNLRLVGIVIALGALVTLVGLVTYPEEGDTPDKMFANMAERASAFRLSSALGAIGTIAIAAAALALGGSRLASTGPGRVGLAGVVVSGVLTVIVWALDGLALPGLAAAGDRAAWNAVAAIDMTLVAFGLGAFGISLALVGVHEAISSARVTRAWAGVVGAIGGCALAVGCAGPAGFAIAALKPFEYGGLPLLLFVAWVGIALARAKTGAPIAQTPRAVA